MVVAGVFVFYKHILLVEENVNKEHILQKFYQIHMRLLKSLLITK